MRLAATGPVILAAVVLAPVALAATSRAPSRTQINAVMRRTVEVTDHSERFATLGRLVAVTVSDGHGGEPSQRCSPPSDVGHDGARDEFVVDNPEGQIPLHPGNRR